MNESLLQLQHRVALVTGGSRGIGRAVAENFAVMGVHVVVNYAHDKVAAGEVVQQVHAKGVDALAVQGNVAVVADAEKMIATTLERFGRIDFLICNAGIWRGDAVEKMSEALWDSVLDINLKGTWAICRTAAPHMKRQGFGRIVIVSSTAGQRGEANYSNYAASKGGQISFTKSLAAELGPHGINVNAVAPGWVDTEMSEVALSDSNQRADIESIIPVGQVATVDEIAWPIIFLCSAWASHINGEILNVNGGSVLCG